MDKVSTIGLDIAKNVFQVHGVDERGKTVVRRRLRRSQVLPFFERQLMERRTTMIAAAALANKIARMAWAMMVRGEHYRAPLPAAA